MSASGLTLTVGQWAERISVKLGSTVEAIVQVGVDLELARTQLGKGRYGQMLAAVGMHEKMAQRFTAIARHEVLADPKAWSHLPLSYSTLYELSSIPGSLLANAIDVQEVTPYMERTEAVDLRARLVGTTTTTTTTTNRTHVSGCEPVTSGSASDEEEEPLADEDGVPYATTPPEPAGDSSPTGSADGAEDETGPGKEAATPPVSSAPDRCPTCGQTVRTG